MAKRMTKSGQKVLKKRKPRGEWNPDNVWCFDIETWGLNAQNFAIGMCKNLSGTVTKKFTTKYAMRYFIDWADDGAIFYAHNAEYDIAGLFEIDEFIDMEKIYPNRLIAAFYDCPQMSIDDVERRSIQFRDSFSIFSTSLAKLGKDLGFGKGETPEKFIKGIETEIDEKDWEYLERDCDILRVAISQLHGLYSEWIGASNLPLPFTAASISYTVFSMKFWPDEWRSKKQKLKGDHVARICPRGCKDNGSKYHIDEFCNKCELPTEIVHNSYAGKLYYSELFDIIGRESYAGGRTQVLGNPTQIYPNVLCYDANSLYPSVMLNNLYPSPKMHFIEQPSQWKLMNILRNNQRLVIAKIMLNGENSDSQFLPAIDEDGRRNYSLKKFHGYLCEPEIKAALDRNWVIESVEEIYSFEANNIFSDFVNFFYNLRREYQKKGDSREIMCKLILNSLYGKFGQRDYSKRVENRAEVTRITRDTDWESTYELKLWNHHKGAYLLEKEPSQICENSFAPIAAFVTSYGRVELLKAIEATDEIYCDTDSIFTQKSREEVEKILKIGDELGDWKMEGNPIPNFVPWEPKVYQKFDEDMNLIQVKHKGANMSDGNLKNVQKARMMNNYRTAWEKGSEDTDFGWGKFRIVDKKSKRFFEEKEPN